MARPRSALPRRPAAPNHRVRSPIPNCAIHLLCLSRDAAVAQPVSPARWRPSRDASSRQSLVARCSSADTARPDTVRRMPCLRSFSPAQRRGGATPGRVESGSDSAQAEHRQVPHHRPLTQPGLGSPLATSTSRFGVARLWIHKGSTESRQPGRVDDRVSHAGNDLQGHIRGS